VVTKIAREGNSVRLSGKDGYALLTGENLQHFEVTANSNGQLETRPIDKFPPPASHHALL
jgi:hypothetical protein